MQWVELAWFTSPSFTSYLWLGKSENSSSELIVLLGRVSLSSNGLATYTISAGNKTQIQILDLGGPNLRTGVRFDVRLIVRFVMRIDAPLDENIHNI